MVGIVVMALDLAVMRAVLDLGSRYVFMLCVAALPMANILAVVLGLALVRPRRRPFLRGFLAFGAIASTLFLVIATSAEPLLGFYLAPPIALYDVVIGAPPGIREGLSYRFLAGFCLLSLWATWPQVAFAFLGGLLSRKPRTLEQSGLLVDRQRVAGAPGWSRAHSIHGAAMSSLDASVSFSHHVALATPEDATTP
jgi:hypothetical protein